ncbi:hypothetical protein J1N35_008744 [Gossypium stocksii]|uniref:CASP-like protein n=1 Tax=Gossypium stocksii TaxID=47602 RepID=A0A9D4AH00_9ROSI|nr:hypothetical protein J1N35_008744 [Gossypium stocksii]
MLGIIPFDCGGNRKRILVYLISFRELVSIALRGDGVLFRPLFCFERSRSIWTLTYDYQSEATSYHVASTGLQSLWSLSFAIIDIYALLVRRSLKNSRVVTLFTIDLCLLRARVRYRAPEISEHFVLTLCSSTLQITSTLTFAAACASAGITVLIDNNLDSCAKTIALSSKPPLQWPSFAGLLHYLRFS